MKTVGGASTLYLATIVQLASAQCNQITTFSSSSSTIPISTMVRSARNLEEFIGFNGPQIISGIGKTGTVSFVNDNNAATFEPTFCKIEFHGSTESARLSLNFQNFYLDTSELIIVDGVGGWRGNRTLFYTGTALPGPFVSETNMVGVLFYFDTTAGTGASFTYSLAEPTTSTNILEAASNTVTNTVAASTDSVTLATVLDSVLRGLFNFDASNLLNFLFPVQQGK